MSVRTRREFLRLAVLGTTAGLAATSRWTERVAQACASIDTGLPAACGGVIDGPDGGEILVEPWWVQVHLPTGIWPDWSEINKPLGRAESGRYFLVQSPQRGSRLRVWDPRNNSIVFVGAEAVGPVGPPEWAANLNGRDGRWIDVSLRRPNQAIAMQGDLPIRKAMVITGMPGYETRPGRFEILRRVANETMDSRTIPGMPISYRYTNVLYTQYFTNDGAAIHYNYWSGNFGAPGSRGCLGMTLPDSKFFWDWADLGIPLNIHA